MNRPSLRNREFQTDVVTYCLTGKCAECTGSYINKILNHRLLCNCGCHKKELHNVVGQPKPTTVPTTLMSKRATDNQSKKDWKNNQNWALTENGL